MSLARLTSQSTQTLSLLLERQRLQTFSSAPASSNLHLPQITRNLAALRHGVQAMEEGEARRLLASQYERMRAMLGEGVAQEIGIESLQIEPSPSSSRPESAAGYAPAGSDVERGTPVYTPYTDDPSATDPYADQDNGTLLQTQKAMMNDQDAHLENLSSSVARQHTLSLSISTELDSHHTALAGLDTEIDHTDARLSRARRQLTRVAKGVKGNGSTFTIGGLILVLLILIVVFKT